MDQYSLTVAGFDGDYRAVLTFRDERIEEFEANSVKQARNRGRALAQAHRDANRPARTEQYTERFSV